ncbi:hypothetical protein ACYOEI_12230 [Singulisphaera rosea]
MVQPRVDLDSSKLSRRTSACVFLVWLVVVWIRVRRGLRRGRFLVVLYYVPSIFVVSVFVGGLVAFIATLLFRAVVRPLVVRWHTPSTDDTMGSFYFAPSEWVVESLPARKRAGRRWIPGALIRTNQCLWFFPNAQGLEVWSCGLDPLPDIRPEPMREFAGGLVLNWPHRVAIRLEGAESEVEVFAVSDPTAVLSWTPTSTSMLTSNSVRT